MSTPHDYRQEHPVSTTTARPDTLDTPDTSVKVAHLVLGLLLLGAAATWALLAGGVVDADALPYLGPGLLVAAGVVGLAVSVAATRRAGRGPRAGVTPGTADQPYVTMEDLPAPGSTRRLEQQDETDPDGEPTAPLHRPEDHR